MTELRQLLAFGAPTVQQTPPGSPRPVPQPRRPSPSRQGQRLSPQFRALRDALAAERARLAIETTEPDPELVVVFDLVGTVEQLLGAVRRVPGMEFLAELEEDEADPDDDFHYVEDGQPADKPVPETLYMVMTNARAVTELIRLFDAWQTDPNVTFAYGLASLRTVFGLLRDIRRWGTQDRVRETGLLERWEEDKAVVGQSGSTRVEIELWYRSDNARRQAAQGEVERLVADGGGTVINTATLAEIGYHAVLADLPYTQVEAVLEAGPDAIELLTAETIMFVSPARPMTIPALDVSEAGPAETAPLPQTAAPRVALLDGLPLANHSQLVDRLVIDDPDDYASRYTAAQRQHGTAMASLICHGDLSSRGLPLSTRLYVRPILEPHPVHPQEETTVRNELLVDLVHRAFRRIFEGDGQQPPAAPSVRVVNLSIGDPARTFARRISPLAKLLDWLAHRYNLVVLVSAGNHPVASTVPAHVVHDVTALRKIVAADIHSRARQRRLLSPAEAVNVVTVGALHDDDATAPVSDSILDAGHAGMPALYSAVGFGYRRAVKPEILLPGGRQLFQRPPQTTGSHVALLPASTAALGPGLRVAAPGHHGDLQATAFTHGTSNAAALATRITNQILDVLETTQSQEGEFRFPDPQYHPVLAKALLVHAASWGEMRPWLADALGLPNATSRRDVTQLVGYGALDRDRVAAASRTRAVLIGAGSIRDHERHTLSFPLPPSLSTTTEWRRMTITLAWLSPVNTRTQRHRLAVLKFQPPQQEIGVRRTQADHHSVTRGTVQHEVLEGSAAVAFTSGQALRIDVDASIREARTASPPVRYGIAVSLELAATARVDVHTEVRQALRVQARERIRATMEVAR